MFKIKFDLRSFFLQSIVLSTIAGLTFFAYWGIQNHQFLNFDDTIYVTSNYHVKNGFSLEHIQWAFSFNDVSYWHPLTNISHMLDCQLFGVKPGPHLLVNLALHIFNALLLFLIILKMTGSRFKAALISLLFAVHPLNVESVAWVAERKTVLSAFFFMTAVFAYVHYTEKKKKTIYVVTLCLYALGLMSKPIILYFPFLMLVLDYWPLRRFKGLHSASSVNLTTFKNPVKKFISLCKSDVGLLILEKAPFLMLSLTSLTISMLSAAKYNFVVNYQAIPIHLRSENLFVSIIQYLRNMAWPVKLSIFYPFPKSIPPWEFLLALSAVFLMTLIAFKMRQSRPWLMMGWLWFLIALSPASGLIQAGLWPAIANRFMYLPMIGIFIMLIWEGDERLRGRYSRGLKVILCVAMLGYFTSLTRVQNIYFSNSFALFNRCLEVLGDNDVAFNNIGDALTNLNRYDEAMKYFAKSIQANPKGALAYNNYGISLAMKKDVLNAIPYLLRAIELNPKLVTAYYTLGVIQSERGYVDEAIKLIQTAMEIDPTDPNVRSNYGMILQKQGKYEEALPHFLFVVRRDPPNLQARLNLSNAYEEAGLYDKAMIEYEALNDVTPRNKGYILYRIAGVYSQQKKIKECEDYLERALQSGGFTVLDYLTSDKRFKHFRETTAYGAFLENHKTKIPSYEH